MELKEETTQPNAYRVEDDNNIEEKDLRRSFLFGKGDEEKTGNEPGMEGKPTGGQKFGENNNTPSGDDANNPSQNAGYTNEYFRRTEPSDEHPENNNFKDANQLGQSNYAQASAAADAGQSNSEDNASKKDEGDNSDDNKTDDNKGYQESTVDGDGDVNIPGPNEVPDQQKVGE